MDLNANLLVRSPLEVLGAANAFRCITAASPLDLFVAHRFLLALLYWKADVGGGVDCVRQRLLRGSVPNVIVEAIGGEASSFELFDSKAPFLQDPQAAAEKNLKSAGSLFAEFAAGTNVAHFHHGDDDNMRLCARCAAVGMLRLVPWTQSGGAGMNPSIHGAPPITALALGTNLAITLGLNLVPLGCRAGSPQWSGPFEPTDKNRGIPFLEAFTWNPRRVNLRPPQAGSSCWRCGEGCSGVVGPIVYVKNAATKKRSDGQPFEWRDPAAFYVAESYVTVKSTETYMRLGRDLAPLAATEGAAAAVVNANPDHPGYSIVVPCTNPGNNKTFDHRLVHLDSFSPPALRVNALENPPDTNAGGFDGWTAPERRPSRGVMYFVQAANHVLTHSDWLVLSAARYREMREAPEAFDVLTGLLWSLRGQPALPSKNTAWLLLKLMAEVPAVHRAVSTGPALCPLRLLPMRQIPKGRSLYPLCLPRGNRLEAAFRNAIESLLRRRPPVRIDWPGFCHGLNELLS